MGKRNFINLFYVIMFLNGVLNISLGPCLNAIIHDFNLTTARGSLFPTAYYVGNLLGILATGFFIKGHWLKKCLSFSVAISAVALVLVSISRSWYLALLFVIANGIALGFLYAYLAAILSKIQLPQQLSQSLNYLYGSFGVGMILGPIIAQLILSWSGNWRFLFFVEGIAMAGSLLLILVLPLPTIETDNPKENPQASSCDAVRQPVFWLLAVAVLFYCGAESSANSWISKYLDDILGLSSAGFVLSLFWVGMSVGRFFSGKLSTIYSTYALLTILALLGGGSMLLAAWAKDVTLCIIAFTIAGIGFSGMYPLLISLSKHLKGEQGMMISFLSSAGGIGSSLMTALVGGISQTAGLRLGITAIGLLPLFSWLMVGIFRYHSYKQLSLRGVAR